MNSQVNWDSKVPPKLHAPVTTHEHNRADPLKRSQTAVTRPQIWQTVAGTLWDRNQERYHYYNRHPVQL
jgi:hypothetical protein